MGLFRIVGYVATRLGIGSRVGMAKKEEPRKVQ